MYTFNFKLSFLILIIPISIYSQYAISGDVYFKGTVGKGFVTEKVFSGISITMEDGIIDDIYISP